MRGSGGQCSKFELALQALSLAVVHSGTQLVTITRLSMFHKFDYGPISEKDDTLYFSEGIIKSVFSNKLLFRYILNKRKIQRDNRVIVLISRPSNAMLVL